MFKLTKKNVVSLVRGALAFALLLGFSMIAAPAMAELAADSYYVTAIDGALLNIQDVSETASTKSASTLVAIGSAALIVMLVVVSFKWISKLAMGASARG